MIPGRETLKEAASNVISRRPQKRIGLEWSQKKHERVRTAIPAAMIVKI